MDDYAMTCFGIAAMFLSIPFGGVVIILISMAISNYKDKKRLNKPIKQ